MYLTVINWSKENTISGEINDKEDTADNGEYDTENEDDTTKADAGKGKENIYKELHHYPVMTELISQLDVWNGSTCDAISENVWTEY